MVEKCCAFSRICVGSVDLYLSRCYCHEAFFRPLKGFPTPPYDWLCAALYQIHFSRRYTVHNVWIECVHYHMGMMYSNRNSQRKKVQGNFFITTKQQQQQREYEIKMKSFKYILSNNVNFTYSLSDAYRLLRPKCTQIILQAQKIERKLKKWASLKSNIWTHKHTVIQICVYSINLFRYGLKWAIFARLQSMKSEYVKLHFITCVSCPTVTPIGLQIEKVEIEMRRYGHDLQWPVSHLRFAALHVAAAAQSLKSIWIIFMQPIERMNRSHSTVYGTTLRFFVWILNKQ